MKLSTEKKKNIIIKNQATMKVQEILSQLLFMKKTRTGEKKSLMKLNMNKKKLTRIKKNLNKKLLKKINSRNIHQLEFKKKHPLITVIPRTIEETEAKREATIETITEVVIGEATITMISLTMATDIRSHTMKNNPSSKKSQLLMTGM